MNPYEISIEDVNETHIRIDAERSILLELREKFIYESPGYKFNPKYKAKVWDGKVSLMSVDGKIYKGLQDQICEFAETREYPITIPNNPNKRNLTNQDVLDFIKTLDLPEWLEIRDYQVEYIKKAYNNPRATVIAPTSAGKSFIIYVLIRLFQNEYQGFRSLIIVPSIGLVDQMIGDFKSYGYEDEVYGIQGGVPKETDCQIVVSTWQSLEGKNSVSADWLNSFDAFFGDEAHTYKAKSLIAIMSRGFKVSKRIGFTGTLDDSILNKQTIIGLFGPIIKETSTVELMDQGFVADLTIKAILLKYSKELRKKIGGKFSDYQDEIKFITNNKKRNSFIIKLAKSLKGNGLIFFTQIEHGQELKRLLEESDYPHPIFFIDGSVKGQTRNEIRKNIDEIEDSISIVSFGTTSTGVSIRNVNWGIFAAPTKSKTRCLQSIGRLLRMSEVKFKGVLFDIGDYLGFGKGKNYTLHHFEYRLNLYSKENFKFKVTTLDIT